MKTNYANMFDSETDKIKNYNKKPKLLLHSCCAPCTSSVIEFVNEFFDTTLFFYNPNIYPESEFLFRSAELKRLISEMNADDIDIYIADYNNDEFEEIAKGYEHMPEGQLRCERCYRLRLEKSIKFASENGFDYVTTTLSVSPHKNAELLNSIGGELAGKYGIKYLFSDFKKKNGYKRSCELSRKYNLYRQNYCGCKYSKKTTGE